MSEREPGYYWIRVREGSKWEPADWFVDGDWSGWYLIGSEVYAREVHEVGPRLEPPA